MHAMVYSSSEEGPVFRMHTWAGHVEVWRAPNHASIAKFFAGPGVPEPFLTVDPITTHSPTRKTLHIGGRDYEWYAINRAPGVTRYNLYTTQDVLLAHLRVDDKHVKLDLRLQVGLPSTMCDGIVAAIVFMSIMKDEWLEDANLKLG
ncbi:hypothetical protein HYPSUDRAFT_80887 [Hypholoma sublateritium FD-334 SS-4]|uniref:Uncharacterized protein n=1 Tax=Hypholoma sublateritium (strain FD-334 SS-4) TaxID=945553 RepID=A0A0D2KI69_HYPSF|nr:hypothetical protein HYPSUDRAFT_80887 [Hypholoma sublateritium FD-334 SS-4]